MQWIDTHTHLFSENFKSDIDKVVEECLERNIQPLLLPNIDSESVESLEKLTDNYPGICLPMMGLHPTSVNAGFREELRNIYALLKARPERYVAVGEIGTDLYWDKTFEREMDIAFREQIRWALEFDKPIVIHSRDSLDWNIEIVKEIKQKEPNLKGVFHCFNGTIEQAKEIGEMGFYMGIGGVITFKNAGVDKTLAEVPMDFLVMETDAPFLAPVPYRGQRNSSEYIPLIAQKLAEIKDLPLSEVSRITTENAKSLFQI
ncbi:MAG: YchF/TatD family DNA exonuclease [Bacteroidetes bacterium]|nr:YchF/TatD family DNA exonuclease [Bacteroidota bacterium]